MDIKVKVEVLPDNDFMISIKEDEFVKDVLHRCLSTVNLINETFGLFLSLHSKQNLRYLSPNSLIFTYNPHPKVYFQILFHEEQFFHSLLKNII